MHDLEDTLHDRPNSRLQCRFCIAGYEISLIEDSYSSIESDLGADLEAEGWTTSPFIVFCKTIVGRYYPIAMLFIQARCLRKRCTVLHIYMLRLMRRSCHCNA